jgi:hypothetical protein
MTTCSKTLIELRKVISATRDLVVHSRLKVRVIGAKHIEDQNTRRAVDRFSRRPGVRDPERVARKND